MNNLDDYLDEYGDPSYGVWSAKNVPVIENEKTLRCKKLIEIIYKENSVGGNCHIVLDDHNFKDESIQWVISEAIPENYHKQSFENLVAELECMLLFLTMTFEEKCSAIEMQD